MRGLLGSLIGDPKRPRGRGPNQAHRPAEFFRARISAVIARLVDPQSRNGAGEAHQQDARSYYDDQIE